MIKVGITGGIGSGKSTVAKIFEVLGIPVYYADDAGKRLMNESVELKQKITAQFGNEVYINGQLNRKLLASIVFNNSEKLQQLNAIVHPATLQDAENWMQQQTSPYAIKEAALIFESGAQQQLNYVIGVQAPEALRIQRTIQRDKITRDEVLARMNRQIDEPLKMKLCDFVVVNDEEKMLIPQVVAVHEKLLQL